MPKSKHQIPGRVRATYEFIKANRERWSVQALCRVLEVAPSGYYDWLQQPVSNRAQEDARLLRLIRASFVASHGIYGAPRVFLDLREAGETCSKHRVARLMRQANLRALHGYRVRRWAVGKPAVLIPNLLQRQFTATRPNTAWVTDITYIRTWQGWLYLAVVMDLFSRLIVGWAAQPTIHRELVLNAVLMAVRRRRPRGTLIHSDQGTQFGSDAWRRLCRSNHLEPSMSRKGNCWDTERVAIVRARCSRLLRGRRSRMRGAFCRGLRSEWTRSGGRLQFLTESECRKWASQRKYPLGERPYSVRADGPPFSRLEFKIPVDAGARVALARAVWSTVGKGQPEAMLRDQGAPIESRRCEPASVDRRRSDVDSLPAAELGAGSPPFATRCGVLLLPPFPSEDSCSCKRRCERRLLQYHAVTTYEASTDLSARVPKAVFGKCTTRYSLEPRRLSLTPDALRKLASSLAIDIEAFDACMDKSPSESPRTLHRRTRLI